MPVSDSNSPELTVVITTCNRSAVLEEALESVALQTWDGDWEVIILDNGSTVENPQTLHRWVDKMPVPTRVIVATERHNPSYARNKAVACSLATSIAFVDDDDVVSPGWVEAIGRALRTHEFVGSKFDYDRLNDPALATLNSFQSERLGRHFGAEIVASGGSGCRRNLWNEVGGSDEAFRVAEDVDFSLRIALRGGIAPHFCSGAIYHVRLRDGAGPAFARGKRRGRAEVQLFAAHRDAFGVSADSGTRVAARWARLLLQLPTTISPRRRVHWAEQAGRRLGRLGSSVREKEWFP
ncbi:MAG: glycosyltransferase family A protein [Nocardioides sp.]